MDIVRPDVKRKKRIRRIIYIVAILILLPLVTYGLSRLKPAPPSVDGSVIWAGTVKRGDMLLEVRGLGTLVPETTTIISVPFEARVSQRLILPGAIVKPNSVIMTMTNPTLEQQLISAQFQLKSAQAQLANTKASVGNSLMALRSTAASVRSQYRQAEMQAAADQAGYTQGVVAKVIADKSQVQAVELKDEDQLAQEQVDSYAASVQDQLAVQQATVSQDQAQLALYQHEVEQLTVRAGLDGVLQEEPAQVGQDMTPGQELCIVAQPSKLKAALQIAETQTKDIQLNQTAQVDTHNGIIPGHVIRIDPAVVNGTRTVDVHLDGPLPEGAVPNLSVEGTVLIEKLKDVLQVGRPVHGDQNQTIGLFKEVDDGKEAVQVQVAIGKVSVSDVEIDKGLNVGDVVILSDMSAYDNFDRIRIK
ncbi:MAG: efflux RND transporter periplasmic adaptor subunit [Candidatus Acidiferrales bacterium]